MKSPSNKMPSSLPSIHVLFIFNPVLSICGLFQILDNPTKTQKYLVNSEYKRSLDLFDSTNMTSTQSDCVLSQVHKKFHS